MKWYKKKDRYTLQDWETWFAWYPVTVIDYNIDNMILEKRVWWEYVKRLKHSTTCETFYLYKEIV